MAKLRWGLYCMAVTVILLTVAGSIWGAEYYNYNVNKLVVKDSPWVDVRAYGAKGDGTTDDTAAIQAAIDSITNGTIFFPPGTYRITSTLTITYTELWKSINLVGVGLGSKLNWDGGNNDVMLHIHGVAGNGWYSKSTIEKLYFYGNSYTGDTKTGIVGIQLGDTPEDINTGIINITIKESTISHTDQGIVGYWESDQVTIQDCYIQKFVAYGVNNDHGGSAWNIINSNISDGETTATHIRTSRSSSRIEGNIIQSAQMSVGVTVVGGVTFGGKNTSITNNYFESVNGGDYGILFQGVDTGVIENNTFNGFLGATLIYLGDLGGVPTRNIRIGPNRHTQSGGYISNLVYATDNTANSIIIGQQYTDGAVTTITGPFRANYPAGNMAFDNTFGVDFSSSDNAAGMTSQVLARYEEGTFTPTVSFGGASVGVTYTAGYTKGRYTRIGNRLLFQGQIVLTSKGSSVGSALIMGLPCTSLDNYDNTPAVSLAFRNVTYANQFQGLIVQNSTTIGLHEITEAGSASDLTNANFDNTAQIQFSGQYICN